MVWYGMVNVDLYSATITKVSNELNTLVSGEKPGFQTLSKGLVVLQCSEVATQQYIQTSSNLARATMKQQRPPMPTSTVHLGLATFREF